MSHKKKSWYKEIAIQTMSRIGKDIWRKFAMPVMRHFPFNPCPGDEYKRRRYPGEVSEVDIASSLR